MSHSQSGWEQNILLPPGFDPSTIHSVESHCTDYAIQAHINSTVWYIIKYLKPEFSLHIFEHRKEQTSRLGVGA